MTEIPYVNNMFALIALLRIRAGTTWHLANFHLIDIASGAGDVENLILVTTVRTGYPLPIDEKHALRTNSVEPF
jgi:hypothetical protein